MRKPVMEKQLPCFVCGKQLEPWSEVEFDPAEYQYPKEAVILTGYTGYESKIHIHICIVCLNSHPERVLSREDYSVSRTEYSPWKEATWRDQEGDVQPNDIRSDPPSSPVSSP